MKKAVISKVLKAIGMVAVMAGAMILFRLAIHAPINIWIVLGISTLIELCYIYADMFSSRKRAIEY